MRQWGEDEVEDERTHGRTHVFHAKAWELKEKYIQETYNTRHLTQPYYIAHTSTSVSPSSDKVKEKCMYSDSPVLKALSEYFSSDSISIDASPTSSVGTQEKKSEDEKSR